MAIIEGEYRVQALEGEEVTLDEVLEAMPGNEFPMCAFELYERFAVFDRPLHVEGQCFVEVFCGCAAATFGVALNKGATHCILGQCQVSFS